MTATEFDVHDRVCMARALRLAERGRYTTAPNPRVGCVLVRGGEVVGEGWHERAGGPHAEIAALAAAGAAARGATAYVSLEPCCHHGRTGPCTEALIEAGVGRVVYGADDPNPRVAGAGAVRLRAAGIDVAGGLLAVQSERLNAGFVMRMRQGRPRVTLKTASSLDGATAMASGESRWITGEAARRDVQRLRAASGAIVTGIGTVLADNPRLTVRGDEFGAEPRQPLRVVLDSRLRTPPDARVLAGTGALLIHGPAASPDDGRRGGAECVAVPAGPAGLDLGAALALLAEREINDVLLEAGPELCGAFLAAGLVDELVIYFAPHIMGSETRRQFVTPAWTRLAERGEVEVIDVRQFGPDLRITARPVERRRGRAETDTET
ncbi:bifunctional diaminohydroxyphosphoribosylaminopyrimidine deaminase/5-amino-6-(5-phosphoribosylamino)uracil reductase RibD [Lentisalinibacter salinarum]|uniref:bifunctional diaminohydroxyphosphoribosylaminopyrimidine deaminase/5-amino-6-(5-phosphoribosylamino)uracil reductase RibD n=1 Tax=Lentisalinibacter salinarum TaxID=2992239 RepID=UPI00386D8285